MNAGRLLGLYPRRWRQRYGAEMTEILEHERLTAQFAIDLVRGAIDAHLHPELAAPLLAAPGGGTVQVPPGSPRTRVYVLTIVLLLLLVFGGLYAYRAQTPALPPIPLTQAVGEVQAGRVNSIEIVGSYATLTLVDGSHQRVTVPDKPLQDLLTGAVERAQPDGSGTSGPVAVPVIGRIRPARPHHSAAPNPPLHYPPDLAARATRARARASAQSRREEGTERLAL